MHVYLHLFLSVAPSLPPSLPPSLSPLSLSLLCVSASFLVGTVCLFLGWLVAVTCVYVYIYLTAVIELARVVLSNI
jgi:hypothetical protein